MSEWVRHAGGMLAWGRPADIWMFAAVPFAVRLLLQWTSKYVQRMEPSSTASVTLAWLAAAMPGFAFLTLSREMIHTVDPRAIGSRACMVHCYGLMSLVVAVIGTAAVGTWRRSRTAAQLLKMAETPSPRLARCAKELGISAVELPTDTPICAVAGILRPRVLLSQGALARLSNEELRAALTHERAHLRRRETLREGVAAFLNQCTIATVPVTLSLYRRSREFAADQEAALEVQPVTLANTLVAFARFHVAPSAVQLADRATLRDRVALLLDGPGPRGVARGASAAAAALIGGAAAVALLPSSVHAVQRALCTMGW